MNIKLKFDKRHLMFIIPVIIAVVLAIVLIVSAVGNKENKGQDGDSSDTTSGSTSSTVSSIPEPTIDDIKNWWENEAQIGQEGNTTVETK